MPTKAELEAEVEALKAELGARDTDAATKPDHDVLGALRHGDIEKLVEDLTAEIEESMTQKPLLTAAGLVLLGYALGRMR